MKMKTLYNLCKLYAQRVICMYILRDEDRHQVDYIFKFERKIFTVEYFELILFYITIKEGLQFFIFK